MQQREEEKQNVKVLKLAISGLEEKMGHMNREKKSKERQDALMKKMKKRCSYWKQQNKSLEENNKQLLQTIEEMKKKIEEKDQKLENIQKKNQNCDAEVVEDNKLDWSPRCSYNSAVHRRGQGDQRIETLKRQVLDAEQAKQKAEHEVEQLKQALIKVSQLHDPEPNTGQLQETPKLASASRPPPLNLTSESVRGARIGSNSPTQSATHSASLFSIFSSLKNTDPATPSTQRTYIAPSVASSIASTVDHHGQSKSLKHDVIHLQKHIVRLKKMVKREFKIIKALRKAINLLLEKTYPLYKHFLKIEFDPKKCTVVLTHLKKIPDIPDTWTPAINEYFSGSPAQKEGLSLKGRIGGSIPGSPPAMPGSGEEDDQRSRFDRNPASIEGKRSDRYKFGRSYSRGNKNRSQEGRRRIDSFDSGYSFRGTNFSSHSYREQEGEISSSEEKEGDHGSNCGIEFGSEYDDVQ